MKSYILGGIFFSLLLCSNTDASIVQSSAGGAHYVHDVGLVDCY